MADITMCANDGCPWASTCYRHQATAGTRQSWAIYNRLYDDCYWPTGGTTNE